jgi:hypothetical protein
MATTRQTGYLRVIDAKQRSRFSLCQPPALDPFRDPHDDIGLREPFLGIGQTQIGEGVATALLDFYVLNHVFGFHSFPWQPTYSRSAALMPVW